MRLCSGHPKVHFGTIVEGSWGWEVGDGGRGGHGGGRGLHGGPPGSLTTTLAWTWDVKQPTNNCWLTTSRSCRLRKGGGGGNVHYFLFLIILPSAAMEVTQHVPKFLSQCVAIVLGQISA